MASNMSLTTLNGVKCYNLSSGKTMPEWLSDKQKRSLSKNDDYRHRIEIIQDFHFPASSQCIRMSPDQKYVVATGVYKPRVKCFELAQLGLKYERYLDSQVVDFTILSEDYRKMVFMRDDRHVEFHAAWGYYYRTRIPHFGRSIAYDGVAADLYVGASGSDIYRINLEQGQHLSPFSVAPNSDHTHALGFGVNQVKVNPLHRLLGAACEDGILRCFDPRSNKLVSTLPVSEIGNFDAGEGTFELSALEFGKDGLSLGLGTSNGHALLYDMRMAKPLMTKVHQSELPIHSIRFLSKQNDNSSNIMLSADRKVVKMWETGVSHGKLFTSIESVADTTDVCCVGDSGMMFMAGDQSRVQCHYIPELGPAPRWCHYLDSITEELEEKTTEENFTVFDNYKFVTKEEINSLGLSDMVGTPMLKAYMHGFFIDSRLYKRVKAVAVPFSYEEWRKKKIAEKIKKRRGDRINIVNKYAVNQDLAQEILDKEKERKKAKLAKAEKKRRAKAAKRIAAGLEAEATCTKPQGDSSDEETISKNNSILTDSRFSSMFTDDAFAVDKSSAKFKELHPEQWLKEKEAAKKAKDTLWKDSFKQSELGNEENSDSSSDEEVYRSHKSTRKALKSGKFQNPKTKRDKKRKQSKRTRDGTDFEKLQNVANYSADANEAQAELKKRRRPLGKRLRDEVLTGNADKGVGRSYAANGIKMKNGAREITYIPKSKDRGTHGKDKFSSSSTKRIRRRANF